RTASCLRPAPHFGARLGVGRLGAFRLPFVVQLLALGDSDFALDAGQNQWCPETGQTSLILVEPILPIPTAVRINSHRLAGSWPMLSFGVPFHLSVLPPSLPWWECFLVLDYCGNRGGVKLMA